MHVSYIMCKLKEFNASQLLADLQENIYSFLFQKKKETFWHCGYWVLYRKTSWENVISKCNFGKVKIFHSQNQERKLSGLLSFCLSKARWGTNVNRDKIRGRSKSTKLALNSWRQTAMKCNKVISVTDMACQRCITNSSVAANCFFPTLKWFWRGFFVSIKLKS